MSSKKTLSKRVRKLENAKMLNKPELFHNCKKY